MNGTGPKYNLMERETFGRRIERRNGIEIHLILVIRGGSVPGHSADNEYPRIIGTPKD